MAILLENLFMTQTPGTSDSYSRFDWEYLDDNTQCDIYVVFLSCLLKYHFIHAIFGALRTCI